MGQRAGEAAFGITAIGILDDPALPKNYLRPASGASSTTPKRALRGIISPE
jgi:hypothetical protein